MSTSEPREEMSGLGADILGSGKRVSMPGAKIMAQNDAAVELRKETLGPDSNRENVPAIDPKVTAIEKVEDTIVSNKICITFLDEYTEKLNPGAVMDTTHNLKNTFRMFRLKKCFYCEKIYFLKTDIFFVHRLFNQVSLDLS